MYTSEPEQLTPSPPTLRRRSVVGVTLVVGTVLLSGTLRAPPASTRFVVLGLATAVMWLIGSVVSGPVRLDPNASWQRVAVPAAIVAVIAYFGFLVADLVGRKIPFVAGALHNVVAKADSGSVAIVLVLTLMNGLGEEVFFRGALFAALPPRRSVLLSTCIYVAATAAAGNVALVIAAAVMGLIFALQRSTTSGLVAPIITHLGWSTLMVLALPR